MTTGRPTGAHHWRKTATIVAFAAIAISTIGFGTPARANEFEPKPTGSVAATCKGGPHFQVQLGNVDGHGPADFHITVTDTTGQPSIPDVTPEQLVAGDSTVIDLPATDHHSYHVGVYADGDTTTTLDEIDYPFNCEGPSATLEVDCGVQGIDVTYRITNPDIVGHDFEVLEPDGSTWIVPVPAKVLQYQAGIDGNDIEHAFEAQVKLGDVVLLSQHVDIDCFDPTAVITFSCGVDGPEAVFDLANEGKSRVLMRWAIDSNITWVDTLAEILAGAPKFEAHIPLEEGQNFTATVTDLFTNQNMVTLTGTATCAAPTTEPPTTEPPTTEPPTTEPPTTEPPTTVVSTSEAPTTAPPAEVSAVSAEPSFTG